MPPSKNLTIHQSFCLHGDILLHFWFFCVDLSGVSRQPHLFQVHSRGFEAAEFEVIVAKSGITMTNQTMLFITLNAALHFEVRCSLLVSYQITS